MVGRKKVNLDNLSPRDIDMVRMWQAGDSGVMIGCSLGMTRNAVLGRVHRLRLAGMKLRSKPSMRRERKPRAASKGNRIRLGHRVARPEAYVVPEALVRVQPSGLPQPIPLNISLLGLGRGQCRYIVKGWGADAFFCGHQREGITAFCAYHYSLCYTKVPVRKAKPKQENGHTRAMH